MKKVSIGVGIVAVVALGWFLVRGSIVTYVAAVNDEVVQFEGELIALDAAVSAGTLAPADAATAQVKIVTRIDSITKAAVSGQTAKISDADRAQLIVGLERLKELLIKYRDTLLAVDASVQTLPVAERPKLHRSGSSKDTTSVATVANETIVEVTDQIEAIIADITDETIVAAVVQNQAETAIETADASSTVETENTADGSNTMGEEVDVSSTDTSQTSTTNESSGVVLDANIVVGERTDVTTEGSVETDTAGN